VLGRLENIKAYHQVYPHFQTISILMRPHQSCNKCCAKNNCYR